MSDTTTKGLRYPEGDVDYAADLAQHIQNLAEDVDAELDDYQLKAPNGLETTYAQATASSDPTGAEAIVLATSPLSTDITTLAQVTASWPFLVATEDCTVTVRVRPGGLSEDPIAACKVQVLAGDDGGGTLSVVTPIPAGETTLSLTVQASAGTVTMAATPTTPITLLARPL